MKITKKGHKYIHEFAERAAKIFAEYGFKYEDIPVGTGFIPNKEYLQENLTERVTEFDPSRVISSWTGRILLTKSDFEPGFRLFLDLKTLER